MSPIIRYTRAFSLYDDFINREHAAQQVFGAWLHACLCVLHIPDLTTLDITGYILDYTADVRPYQTFSLWWHLFSHSDFPEYLVISCLIDFRMISDYRMADGYFSIKCYVCIM